MFDSGVVFNSSEHKFTYGKINSLLKWNPKFAVVPTSKSGLLLISETETYVLTGKQIYILNSALRRGCSLAEFVLNHDSVQKNVLMINMLMQLCDKNLIVTAGDTAVSNFYYIPDFSRQAVCYQSPSSNINLIMLSQYGDLNIYKKWVVHLNAALPLTVVVVDDYLDPRLSNINDFCATKNRSWILLKPTGERFLLGPYFQIANNETACLHCLQKSILKNQPARHWLKFYENRQYMAVPVCSDKVRIMQNLLHASKLIHTFTDNVSAKQVLEFNAGNASLIIHPVVRQSNCSHCTDDELASNAIMPPVNFQAGIKLRNMDSGSRTVDPSVTIRKIKHVLSPLTGVVNTLTQLPNSKQQKAKIYSATYFKSPFNVHEKLPRNVLQFSLGKGVRPEQSQASALCEALERYSAQYQGNEHYEQCSADELINSAVLPHDLASYSEYQYSQFTAWQQYNHSLPFAVKKFQRKITMRWIKAWSLTQNEYCYLPFTYCYANTPLQDEYYCRWNSNGNAAGNTMEEAILQGLFELVERDAVAVWWYNKIPRPKINIDLKFNPRLQKIHNDLQADWQYWLLNVTHDLNIPVVAAIAQHKQLKQIRIGFGCHLEPQLACERALTELLQIIAIGNQGSLVFDLNALRLDQHLIPDSHCSVTELLQSNHNYQEDICNDIHFCIEQLRSKGLQTIVYDYRRKEVPLKVVKVIVPGLCHMWPQFGNQRLYQVPVELRWQRARRTESELNPTLLLL